MFSSFLRKNSLLLALFLVVLYFPVFWKASLQPLSIWDEARAGVNALEINGFKSAIIPHFEGSPDMFSLKPPLLPILQRVSMEIVGYNVLGVRLPSMVATFSICLLFLSFCYTRYGSLWPGIISSLVLISSPGFMRDHVARTGDYDALLSFFMAAYTLFYFLYLENPVRKRHLSAAAMLLILGILTKGVAALIPIPGLLIYTLVRRKTNAVFGSARFYMLLLLFIVTVVAVYGFREYHSPGYLKFVIGGELFKVPTQPVGGHGGPWWYYIDSTLLGGFIYFSAFMLLGIMTGFTTPFRDRLFPFLLSYLACYFLVISLAATKTPWYDAPFYPLAALAAGLFIFKVAARYLIKQPGNRIQSSAIMTVVCIIIFSFPYYSVIRQNLYVTPQTWDMLHYGPYMEKLRQEKTAVKNYTVLGKGYDPQALFYSEALSKKGFHTPHKNVRDQLTPGEMVLCCERSAIDDLKAQYKLTYLNQDDPCVLVRIENRIDSSAKATF